VTDRATLCATSGLSQTIDATTTNARRFIPPLRA
jgi:hypothetical protein